MSAKVFIDTNVLVYLFDDSEPKKRDKARRRLEAAHEGHDLVVSTQVLQELFVALTRGSSPIAPQDIAAQAVRQVAALTVVQIDAPLIFAAIEARQRLQLSFWDALIVSAAVEAGCQTILTEDLSDGHELDGVRVENPFA